MGHTAWNLTEGFLILGIVLKTIKPELGKRGPYSTTAVLICPSNIVAAFAARLKGSAYAMHDSVMNQGREVRAVIGLVANAVNAELPVQPHNPQNKRDLR